MRLHNIAVLIALILLSACDTASQQGEKYILPEMDSAGAKLYQENCSNCHAPPRPDAHTAEEWPNVIYRMQERRRMKAYSVMDGSEVEVLLDYLQRHAKN